MAKQNRIAPAERRDTDPLAESIDRLTAEIGTLRDVIGELREDFSWVTRNGLPIQLMEQASTTRAEARAEKSLDEESQQEIVESIVSVLEAVAQGQLEVVLTALDGIHHQLLAALEKRSAPQKSAAAHMTQDTPSDAHQSTSSAPSEDSPRCGRLF